MIVPAEPTATEMDTYLQENYDMPATPQDNAQPQQGTTVIPTDTPVPAPQEGTVIPSETATPQNNTQPQQGTTVVPADTPAVRKRQSTDTPQTPVQERNRMSDDGVTIYFNDTEDVPPSTGRPATPAKSADTPQKKINPSSSRTISKTNTMTWTDFKTRMLMSNGSILWVDDEIELLKAHIIFLHKKL